MKLSGIGFNNKNSGNGISRFRSFSIKCDAVVNKNPNATKTAHLREEAAEVRVRSVESQLSLASTLCATAEIEIRADEHDAGRKLVRKLRRHAKTISVHLNEPGRLPRTAVPDLRKRLTQLEKRIEKIAANLPEL